MDYRDGYKNLMKRRMEAEMSKFEEEISRPSHGQPQSVPGMPSQGLYQFIPHQIQRQVPSLTSKLITSPPVITARTVTEKQSSHISSTNTSRFNNVAGPSQPYTISPMELPPGITASSLNQTNTTTSGGTKRSAKNSEKSQPKAKKALRMAGGQVWEDQSLLEWDPDDFRLFVGDLGNDVTDEVLTRGFSKYPSFVKAKVVRDKRSNKSKGYGFVSFKDPQDYIRAMREMDGKYLGSRPIKLRKSTWKERSFEIVKKKEKEKSKLIS